MADEIAEEVGGWINKYLCRQEGEHLLKVERQEI